MLLHEYDSFALSFVYSKTCKVRFMINFFLFHIPKCLSSSKFCHFKFMYYKIYFKNLIPQLNRDLKPENIVLKKDENDNIMFKIIDLGYAKDISAQDKATSLVGTWHYIVSQFLLFDKKKSSNVFY